MKGIDLKKAMKQIEALLYREELEDKEFEINVFPEWTVFQFENGRMIVLTDDMKVYLDELPGGRE